MSDWYANPVVWTLVGLAFVAAAGRFLYWRGRVDGDRDAFKKFMADIGEKIDKIEKIVHELRKNVHGLQQDVHGLRKGVHELRKGVHELRKGVHGLRKDVHELRKGVHGLRKDVHGLLGVTRGVNKAGGPLTLTELGKQVVKCLESKDIFQNLEPLPSDRIHKKQPFEIHGICFEYIYNELIPSSEMDAAIRFCAYENGVKYNDVLEVIAIELRDRLLPKHEE